MYRLSFPTIVVVIATAAVQLMTHLRAIAVHARLSAHHLHHAVAITAAMIAVTVANVAHFHSGRYGLKVVFPLTNILF